MMSCGTTTSEMHARHAHSEKVRRGLWPLVAALHHPRITRWNFMSLLQKMVLDICASGIRARALTTCALLTCVQGFSFSWHEVVHLETKQISPACGMVRYRIHAYPCLVG